MVDDLSLYLLGYPIDFKFKENGIDDEESFINVSRNNVFVSHIDKWLNENKISHRYKVVLLTVDTMDNDVIDLLSLVVEFNDIQDLIYMRMKID